MRYIIDIQGNYLGFAGPNTQLQEGQFELTIAPPIEFVKPKWVNNEWIEDATEQEILFSIVPLEVGLWKVRAILTIMGLEEAITLSLSGLPEPNRTAALAIWDRGNTVDRFSPTVAYLQQALGLTDNEVDNIFIEANKIAL
jgi:hypothetical protein